MTRAIFVDANICLSLGEHNAHLPTASLITCTLYGTVYTRAHQEGTSMTNSVRLKRVEAFFFENESGREPVRDWLIALPRDDRRDVGRGLMTLEFGWPIGMPLARAMGQGLHELRIDLSNRRSARVLFYIDSAQRLVLLHAFMKSSRTTPKSDLELARSRMKQHRRSLL
jgi:phage-related protein